MAIEFLSSKISYKNALKFYGQVFDQRNLSIKNDKKQDYIFRDASYMVWNYPNTLDVFTELSKKSKNRSFYIYVRSYFDDRVDMNGEIVNESFYEEVIPQYNVFPIAKISNLLDWQDLEENLKHDLKNEEIYSDLFYVKAVALLSSDLSWGAYAHIDRDFILFYKPMLEKFMKLMARKVGSNWSNLDDDDYNYELNIAERLL